MRPLPSFSSLFLCPHHRRLGASDPDQGAPPSNSYQLCKDQHHHPDFQIQLSLCDTLRLQQNDPPPNQRTGFPHAEWQQISPCGQGQRPVLSRMLSLYELLTTYHLTQQESCWHCDTKRQDPSLISGDPLRQPLRGARTEPVHDQTSPVQSYSLGHSGPDPPVLIHSAGGPTVHLDLQSCSELQGLRGTGVTSGHAHYQEFDWSMHSCRTEHPVHIKLTLTHSPLCIVN